MTKNLISEALYILIALTFLVWFQSFGTQNLPIHTLYLSFQLVSIYIKSDPPCQAVVSDFCHDAQCLHTKISSIMFTQIKAAILI